MAYQFMEFQHGDATVDFSEFTNGSMLIRSWGNGSSVTVKMDKENLIELRKWISKQLKAMDETPKVKK